MSATATSTSTALPSGYHEPLALVTANNHGGWIVICNAFGLVVALICLAIRLYIRSKINPPLARDDWTLVGATALAIIQLSIVFEAVHEGFGKSLDLISDSSRLDVQKLIYAADIFYVLTLYATKCSLVLLYNRIAPDRAHAVVAWAVFSVCAALGVISLLLVALRCDLSAPWIVYGQKCSSLIGQWAAVAAFDIITEIAVFAMSFHLVWKLQTPLARKARVVFAFGLRLPLIVMAAIRLYYVDRYVQSSNPTLIGAIAAILSQTEIFYSLMSATIPCLRPFLAGFITNFGAMGGETVMGGSHIGTNSRSDPKRSKGSFMMASAVSNHEMGNMSSMQPEKSGLRTARSSQKMSDGTFRGAQNDASCTHMDSSSIGSNESQKMIIKKEVEYRVEESDGFRTPSRTDMYDIGVNRL